MRLLRGVVISAYIVDCVSLNLRTSSHHETNASSVLEAWQRVRSGTFELAHEKDVRPRILAMDDCSGSTFVLHTAIDLIQRHGVNVYFPGNYEILKPAKNSVYTSNPDLGMGQAMEKIAQKAEHLKEVLVFDAELHKLKEYPDVVEVMTARDAVVVHSYRSNLLDEAICKIRDCFNKQLGTPVDASGREVDLCFERRFAEDNGRVKARIVPERLVEWMRGEMESQKNASMLLNLWGFARPYTVTYEHLAAFQYDNSAAGKEPCDFECSFRAWCKLLLSWSVEPDMEKVRNFLLDFKKTGQARRTAPSPHADTVYNIDEVKVALRDAGPEFEELVRK